MAKKLGLLDEVKQLEAPPKAGNRDWWLELADKQPDFYFQLIDLIDLWLKKDALVFSRFPRQRHIEAFIASKVKAYKINIKDATVGKLIRERRHRG